jgi:glycerol-3-phosphate acyltransferase PlsX
MTLPVAVDAMGGDRAPGEIVEGCREAATSGLDVVLVGRAADLPPGHGLPVVDASEVIAMDEDPAGGVRRKKDSSLVRAAELVRDGTADAMVSAGNTGATMASALLRMGRIRGVTRPAIASVLPVPGGGHTVLLDAGANAECHPEWLVQFAQMGSAFARLMVGVENPAVGLLSIGEEHVKGNSFVKATHELLAVAPNIRFVGNVEGRDVLEPHVDVVVTDGFTGNVVLKTLEGSGKSLTAALRAAVGRQPEAERLLEADLAGFYDLLDWESQGGAMLLGVEGVCIIAHGASSARAVLGAVKMARQMADADVVGALRSAIGR